MILQALVAYYEALAKQNIIPQLGYASVKVSYALRLGWDGSLLGILPVVDQVQRGKKTVEVPQMMPLPEPVVKSVNIASNFLFENGMYLLGANAKGNPERARQCFEAAALLHHQILDSVEHPAAKAITLFFDQWDCTQCETHPVTAPYLEAIFAGGKGVFQLPDGQYAHAIAPLRQAWEAYRGGQSSEARMQCLVTGRKDAPVARLHNKIKGVKGGQPTGTSIVSFNAKSYESYGREGAQGLNAPVSEYAAFAYTTALNYLLASPYRLVLGNMTLVYWAQTGEPTYQSIFSSMVAPEENDEDRLVGMMQRINQALPIDANLHLETPFYVLGVSPNAGRLAIRFFWPSTFGEIAANISAHYRRLEIDKPPFEKRTFLSPYWLLRETVSPAASDPSASSLLEGAVMRAIITGHPYPYMLAQSVITRIRAEHDINWRKAAILKAWLLHNGYQNTSYQEVLTVSRNENSNIKAYVLGRLFALLEKAQEEANPGINATIKDRYFSSACAAPGTVFPILLKLSNHHLAKAQYGRFTADQIGGLMDRLNVEDDPFPMQLALKDQGLFILGYYQERQARVQKKNEVSA